MNGNDFICRLFFKKWLFEGERKTFYYWRASYASCCINMNYTVTFLVYLLCLHLRHDESNLPSMWKCKTSSRHIEQLTIQGYDLNSVGRKELQWHPDYKISILFSLMFMKHWSCASTFFRCTTIPFLISR